MGRYVKNQLCTKGTSNHVQYHDQHLCIDRSAEPELHQQKPRDDAVPHFDGLPRRHRQRQLPPTGRSPPRCARTTRRTRSCRTRSASAPARSTPPTSPWTSSIGVVDQIKQKILLAKTASTADRAKIQSEIAAYQSQLKDNIGGANYSGSNLLKTGSTATDPTNLTVISSYNRDAAGAVTTGTIDVALTNIRLINTVAATKDGLLDKETATTGAGAVTVSVLTLSVSTATLDAVDFDGLLGER